MNLAHLHLVLNHFPIIGTVIGLGLFVGSLFGWKRADGTRRFREAYVEGGKGCGDIVVNRLGLDVRLDHRLAVRPNRLNVR